MWLALVLLVTGTTTAQTARLSAPSDSVSAGTPFEVSVSVARGPGQQVTFPEPAPGAVPGALRFGDAEVVSVRRLPPAVRGGARVDSAVYRVVVFSADSARVGPIPVRVGAPSDSLTATAPAALVPVRSVLQGEVPPYEPAPVGPPEPFPSALPLWIAVGLLALVATGAAIWTLVRTLRRPAPVPVVLPYPAAVARLDALDAAAPPPGADAEVIEAHVVAVRDALRGYLADRLSIPAREATTAELAALLSADARVSPEAADAVYTALLPTDLVAFAHVRPRPEVVGELRDATRAAVETVERGIREAAAQVAREQEAVRPSAPSS